MRTFTVHDVVDASEIADTEENIKKRDDPDQVLCSFVWSGYKWIYGHAFTRDSGDNDTTEVRRDLSAL